MNAAARKSDEPTELARERRAARSVARATGGAEARERILRAAERVFAAEGFSGASMRAIAGGAGVAQALLHYHFGDKRSLYAAVVAWRAKAINAERVARLKALGPAASLRGILQALFAPALGEAAGGEDYARIMASLMTGDAMHQDLVREHYDPTAQTFIDALARATGRPRGEAAWGYSLAIHVLVAAMARSGRTERLAGEAGPADTSAFLERIVAFAAGGVEAPPLR